MSILRVTFSFGTDSGARLIVFAITPRYYYERHINICPKRLSGTFHHWGFASLDAIRSHGYPDVNGNVDSFAVPISIPNTLHGLNRCVIISFQDLCFKD
jgi:hypothetical protein